MTRLWRKRWTWVPPVEPALGDLVQCGREAFPPNLVPGLREEHLCFVGGQVIIRIGQGGALPRYRWWMASLHMGLDLGWLHFGGGLVGHFRIILFGSCEELLGESEEDLIASFSFFSFFHLQWPLRFWILSRPFFPRKGDARMPFSSNPGLKGDLWWDHDGILL